MKCLYIHGYNGSVAGNEKTRILSEIAEVDIIDYDEDPSYLSKIEPIANEYDFIVGSSLGGYIADYVGKKFNIPTVLINPVTDILKLDIDIGSRYANELNSNAPDLTIRNGTLVLLDKGDELLPFEIAQLHYNKIAQIETFDGGNHSFIHMKESLDIIKRFIEMSIL